jgi:hypothetical protein
VADKALDDKGENDPGGQHRQVAGSLGGTSLSGYGRTREGMCYLADIQRYDEDHLA